MQSLDASSLHHAWVLLEHLYRKSFSKDIQIAILQSRNNHVSIMSWLDIRQKPRICHHPFVAYLLHNAPAKRDILHLFSTEPEERRGWTEQDIYEQCRRIIGYWDSQPDSRTDNHALRKSDLILPQRGWDKYHRSDLAIRRHFPTGCRLRSAPQWRRKSLGGGGECFRLGSAAPSQFSPSSMWNISL